MFMFEAELCLRVARVGADLTPTLLSFNLSFPLSQRGLLLPLLPFCLLSPRSTGGQ